MTYNGMRARVRYSLDGSLDKQTTVEGIVHARERDITVFHVQRDQVRPGSNERRYSAVIYSRVIDIAAAPTLIETTPHEPQRRRRDDACQNCLGMNQPPDRAGRPNHCGECPCCKK